MDGSVKNGGSVAPAMARQQASSASLGQSSIRSGVLSRSSSEPVLWNNNNNNNNYWFLSPHIYHPQSPIFLANAVIWDATAAATAISQSASLLGLLPWYQTMVPPLTSLLGSNGNSASEAIGNSVSQNSTPCGLFGTIGTGPPARRYEWGLPPMSLAPVGLPLLQHPCVSGIGTQQTAIRGGSLPHSQLEIAEGMVRHFSMGESTQGRTAVLPPAIANLEDGVGIGVGIVRGGRRPAVGGTHKPKLRKTCDACSKHKKACNGSKPCYRCTRRQNVCVFSMRKRTGPKGPKKRRKLANDRPVAPTEDEEVIGAAANLDGIMSAAVQETLSPSGRQARSESSSEGDRDSDVPAAGPTMASILSDYDSSADDGGGPLGKEDRVCGQECSSSSRSHSDENGSKGGDDFVQMPHPSPGVAPLDRCCQSAGGNYLVSAEPNSDSGAVTCSRRDVNGDTCTSTSDDGDSTARYATSWQALLLVSDRDIHTLPAPELAAAAEAFSPVNDEAVSTPAQPGTPLVSQCPTTPAAVAIPTPTLSLSSDRTETESLVTKSFIAGTLSEEEGTSGDDLCEGWGMGGLEGFDPELSATAGAIESGEPANDVLWIQPGDTFCGVFAGDPLPVQRGELLAACAPPLSSTRQDDLDDSADVRCSWDAGSTMMEPAGPEAFMEVV